MLVSHPSAFRSNRGEAGFTVLETCFAIGMVALFIAMLMLMNSNVLGLLRTSKDNISASQTLQERVEQMRIANWIQITDSAYLANTLFASACDSTAGLTGAIETFTISPHPAKSGFTPVQVVRENNATRVVSSNSNLKDERMVRVDLELNWRGYPQNRQRFRAATAVIAKGGITK